MNAGKTLFCASHSVCAVEDLRAHHRVPQWRRRCAHLGLRRFVSHDGLRAIDVVEPLRDIEVCLTANQAKLFHMGLKDMPTRSTLSDALNLRDWLIYHALAMRLIVRARELYAKEPLDIDLNPTVYALDATTIDLGLSLFNWAPFRSTRAAVKMRMLLDLRGGIPAFIHISDGKMREINVLDFLPVEAGVFYVDRSKNAVKTQIWCAMSICLLIAIVKKDRHLNASLYACCRFNRSRYPRKPRFHAPCSPIPTELFHSSWITN